MILASVPVLNVRSLGLEPFDLSLGLGLVMSGLVNIPGNLSCSFTYSESLTSSQSFNIKMLTNIHQY